MISLLIDTHDKEVNIVLYKDHKLMYIFSETYNNQSKELLPNIAKVLNDNSQSINDIDEIIVINGPGSFTGIRIGVTIAKTIAYSLGIPIWSISSLLLKTIGNLESGDYSVVIPDNKGFFVGEFDSNNHQKGNYFYLSKKEFSAYSDNNKVVDNKKIKWELLFENDNLTKEDCYNIKPIYIKKIEVEKWLSNLNITL